MTLNKSLSAPEERFKIRPFSGSDDRALEKIMAEV